MFYECLIQACHRLKKLMKSLSELMLKADFKEADFQEADHRNLFKMLDNLATGKFSLLKVVMMFTMTLQLYEVGSTDVDEVAEALRSAIEGL
jgi:hypothetical protein